MKQNRILKLSVTSVALLGVAALALAGSTTATADPSAARTYVAVGSDTIQDVYNGFGNGYTLSGTTISPNLAIGSWDAFGAGGVKYDTITVRSGATPIKRPAGSGDGVKALSAAWNGASNTYTDAGGNLNTVTASSIDIARSSSHPAGTSITGQNLDFVPLARDAVSVGIQTAASPITLPTNFSTADLTFLYSGVGAPTNTGLQLSGGLPVYKVGATSVPLNVKLPQAGSGTRSFFLGAIGNPTLATYVTSTIDENHANELNTLGDIAPFSAAQWVAQKKGLSTTFTGTNSATLAITSINGTAAVTGSGTSSVPGALYGSTTTPPSSGTGVFNRDVFSVIPVTKRSDAALYTFVSATLPQASYSSSTSSTVKFVVEDFGFLHLSYNTAASQGHYYGTWTN